MEYVFKWTDGNNQDFIDFSEDMEEYYNQLVGGAFNRKKFIPHNSLVDIKDVLIVYENEKPVGCASFKEYNSECVEIKRVWISKNYRGKGISRKLMLLIEFKAKEKGFKTAILQTRETCVEAVSLYKSIGYKKIDNYPPYEEMEQAICFYKEL